MQPQALRIALALGVPDRAVGGPTPGQQLATAPPRLSASSPPVSDQGAFIRGHRPPDLEQELIVWVLTHRPVEALDRPAPLGECLDEEHWMHIVAGQPIGAVSRTRAKAAKAARSRRRSRPGRFSLAPR
jgi:hypothetical protein